MLDIKFIRENSSLVQKAAKDKGIEIDINHVLEIDSKHRELFISVQKLREERNILTSGIKGKPTPEQIEKGKNLKERFRESYSISKMINKSLVKLNFTVI